MKAIHLTTGKDEMRPANGFIQCKGGFVHATNNIMLIKLPTKEVFGTDLLDDPIITDEEELYFNGLLWATAKMHTAASIRRTGQLFEAVNRKGIVVGQIQALNATEFHDKVGKFTNVDVVLPDADTVTVELSAIAFNAKAMATLCESFGGNLDRCSYTFYGLNKGIRVKQAESEGVGLIMPTALSPEEL